VHQTLPQFLHKELTQHFNRNYSTSAKVDTVISQNWFHQCSKKSPQRFPGFYLTFHRKFSTSIVGQVGSVCMHILQCLWVADPDPCVMLNWLSALFALSLHDCAVSRSLICPVYVLLVWFWFHRVNIPVFYAMQWFISGLSCLAFVADKRALCMWYFCIHLIILFFESEQVSSVII
jgi:hypothetical protein